MHDAIVVLFYPNEISFKFPAHSISGNALTTFVSFLHPRQTIFAYMQIERYWQTEIEKLHSTPTNCYLEQASFGQTVI